WLGSPDAGLMVSTYVGYWFVGLAMLAIGMVASFLTGNLTVAFILGALFNAPLVMAMYADSLLPGSIAIPSWAQGVFGGEAIYPAQLVKSLSAAEQFRDFGRGVISLSAVAYFLLLVVLSL